MKITVGSILFNTASLLPKGMLEDWLNCIYDIGDEIILVHGATQAKNHYWDGDAQWATTNGKSTDDTVEICRSFPDPQKKIQNIERDGFWDGKTQMCNVWAQKMTGDYIWQIDSDEFYLKKDVVKIKELLNKRNPNAVHFYDHHFWGNVNHIINKETEYLWPNTIPWKRIFKHDRGSLWLSHEPPEYLLSDGSLCNENNVISRIETDCLGIRMFHYSCISRAQAEFKTKFYRRNMYLEMWDKWQSDHSIPLINGTKTEPFVGEQPIDIEKYSGKLW